MNYNPKVTEYFDRASNEQKIILDTLRRLVHDSVDDVYEEIKWGFPVFSQSKDFAYLRFSKNHVTLGFYNIDKIIDPESLLEGEGNTLKHIKIKKVEEIRMKIISDWLKQIVS